MSDNLRSGNAIVVDIGEWVEKARADPAAYLERQATEVFLIALGMAEPYSDKIFLKGGILMGVVYQSHRQTADIDFTTILEPDHEIADQLRTSLNAALPRAAAELGYPDLMCRIQTIKYRPRPESFAAADGPALEITVGYAIRGSPQQKHFDKGQASNVLHADINFREPIGAVQIVKFAQGDGVIWAYSLMDLMSEKLRALLQQKSRNRYRRQDIYDLDILIQKFDFDIDQLSKLHALLLKKAAARDIIPDVDSLSNPEIVRRARAEWETLRIEIGEVPDFEASFERVDAFYRSLPWG